MKNQYFAPFNAAAGTAAAAAFAAGFNLNIQIKMTECALWQCVCLPLRIVTGLGQC